MLSDQIVAAGETDEALMRVFKSAAFATFLRLHRAEQGSVALEETAACGRGLFARRSFCEDEAVLPYTGVFMPEKTDDLPVDRDIAVEWRCYSATSGQMVGRQQCVLRGWEDGLSAAMVNHRCVAANCVLGEIDVFVFFNDKQRPWLLYCSAMYEPRLGHRIDADGVYQANQRFAVPPTLAADTEEDVLLLGWPVLHALRKIAPGEELTVNYGEDYVAHSPYLRQTLVRPGRWSAMREDNNAVCCCCADCARLADPAQRSVLLPLG